MFKHVSQVGKRNHILYFIHQNRMHISCKNAQRGNDNLIPVENPIMNMT